MVLWGGEVESTGDWGGLPPGGGMSEYMQRGFIINTGGKGTGLGENR